MSLNINSPSYSSIYGVIDEVYKMCRDIEKNIDISLYTKEFDSIGITPMIAPKEELEKGKWKEVKRVLFASRLAIISLQIDYDIFHNGNVQDKMKLILQNIFDSLLIVKRKAKSDFNYELLIKDILAIARKHITIL